jgi:hypothetical protein
MSWQDLLPATAMGLGATLVLALVRLAPSGEVTVLVRLPSAAAGAALAAAASADASLVDEPAPGLAVLHGDGARIRGVVGPALIWNGAFPCSQRL